MNWFKKPQSKEPQILRLGWLGVKVADIMAEALFLEQKLGLKFLDEGNSNRTHHVRYDCGGLELELVSGGTAWATRPKPRHGQPDVFLIPSFAVDNIETLATQLSEQAVERTQLYEQGWATNLLFFDPNRNLWQLNELRTAPAIKKAWQIGTIWLRVENLAAQTTFYQEVLGLPISQAALTPQLITLAAQLDSNLSMTPYADGLLPDYPALPTASVSEEATPIQSLGTVFFNQGIRLALVPGHRLAEQAQIVWGQDNAFLAGFQTNDLAGFTKRLKAAGVTTSQPFAFYHSVNPKGQALRFCDPEGHMWQIYE